MAPRQDEDFLFPALMTTYIADRTLYDDKRDAKPAPKPIADPEDMPEDAYEAMAGSFRPDMRKSPHDNPFSFV